MTQVTTGPAANRQVSTRKAIRLPHALHDAMSTVADQAGVSTQQAFDAVVLMIFGDDAGEIEPVLRDALRSYYHQRL